MSGKRLPNVAHPIAGRSLCRDIEATEKMAAVESSPNAMWVGAVIASRVKGRESRVKS